MISTATVATQSSAAYGNCPFCSAVSQTLRQEMSAMDTAVIGEIVPGSETDSDAEFKVLNVIRGTELVRKGQTLRINYFGKAKAEQKFLLMGVDPPDLLWSSPQPVDGIAIDYVERISQLPDDAESRLKFFLDYLEHPESLLARDAYDEFASAEYDTIKALKPQMDREQLLEWIRDTSIPPERKRLYLVMLGVCGKKSDADLLENLLRSDDPNKRAGLDAMIACYATLKGKAGLKLIDEMFLKNKQSQYADTYAAIMALRFHGTDGNVIEKERVLESMRLILDRPELADLVIPDLARWEDWTQIDKLVELFKQADEKSSWVRVPVINYLRACPLPEAEKKLAELKAIDPAAFKRATSFFPVPQATGAGGSESSSALDVRRFQYLASDAVISLPPDTPLAFADKRNSATDMRAATEKHLQSDPAAIALLTENKTSLPTAFTSPMNRALAISVVCMVSLTLWLAMWLMISGAGNHTKLETAIAKRW